MIQKYNWSEDTLVVHLKGKVQFNELDLLRKRIWGDKRFDNLKYGIYNMLEVKSIDITPGELNIISTLDISASIWKKKLKLAFVLKDESLISIMNNYIFEMKKTNWEIRLFNHYSKALKWCNI